MDFDNFFYLGLYASTAGNGQVEQVRQDAAQADSKLKQELHQIEARLDRVQLACRAMMEIIVEELDMPADTIAQKIAEIDLRDGKLDGRAGQSVLECVQCHRKTRASRGKCLYCGEPLPPGDPLDSAL